MLSMSRYDRAPFSPTARVRATRAFTVQGIVHKQGDTFNWKKLGCTEQQLLRMWRSRMVEWDAPQLKKEKREEQ